MILDEGAFSFAACLYSTVFQSVQVGHICFPFILAWNPRATDGLPAHYVRMHIERVGKQITLSYALNKKHSIQQNVKITFTNEALES